MTCDLERIHAWTYGDGIKHTLDEHTPLSDEEVIWIVNAVKQRLNRRKVEP